MKYCFHVILMIFNQLCHLDTVINDAIVHCFCWGVSFVLLMLMVWGAFHVVWNMLAIRNHVILEQFISCPEHSSNFSQVTSRCQLKFYMVIKWYNHFYACCAVKFSIIDTFFVVRWLLQPPILFAFWANVLTSILVLVLSLFLRKVNWSTQKHSILKCCWAG